VDDIGGPGQGSLPRTSASGRLEKRESTMPLWLTRPGVSSPGQPGGLPALPSGPRFRLARVRTLPVDERPGKGPGIKVLAVVDRAISATEFMDPDGRTRPYKPKPDAPLDVPAD